MLTVRTPPGVVPDELTDVSSDADTHDACHDPLPLAHPQHEAPLHTALRVGVELGLLQPVADRPRTYSVEGREAITNPTPARVNVEVSDCEPVQAKTIESPRRDSAAWRQFLPAFLRYAVLGSIWSTAFAVLAVASLYASIHTRGFFRMFNTIVVMSVIFFTAHLLWPMPRIWHFAFLTFSVIIGLIDLAKSFVSRSLAESLFSFVINAGFVIVIVVPVLSAVRGEFEKPRCAISFARIRGALLFVVPWALAQILVTTYDFLLSRWYRKQSGLTQLLMRGIIYPIVLRALLLITKKCAESFTHAQNREFLIFSFVALKVIFGRMLISSSNSLYIIAALSIATAVGESVMRAAMAYLHKRIGFYGFQSTPLTLLAGTFEQLMEAIAVVSMTSLDFAAAVALGNYSVSEFIGSLAIQLTAELTGDLISCRVEYHFRQDQMFQLWCKQPRRLVLLSGLYVVASASLAMPRIAAKLVDKPLL